jgi:hypothetical protein
MKWPHLVLPVVVPGAPLGTHALPHESASRPVRRQPPRKPVFAIEKGYVSG